MIYTAEEFDIQIKNLNEWPACEFDVGTVLAALGTAANVVRQGIIEKALIDALFSESDFNAVWVNKVADAVREILTKVKEHD